MFSLLTCLNNSVLPIISFIDLYPNFDKCSLVSLAINEKRFTTFSGVPSNFFLNSGFCVQIPTGQTSLCHCLTSIQPIATKDVVPIPYSSAPRIDAIIISFPVFKPPSVRNLTL